MSGCCGTEQEGLAFPGRKQSSQFGRTKPWILQGLFINELCHDQKLLKAGVAPRTVN
jgi:hypothetical protein